MRRFGRQRIYYCAGSLHQQGVDRPRPEVFNAPVGSLDRQWQRRSLHEVESCWHTCPLVYDRSIRCTGYRGADVVGAS
ncbi:hypothetical protein [Paenibacillus durus]|uniref:hypothetical protein n=1 Tax=Paenibacillus durus TaxID=44251 RepID=UPI0011876A57|nr:hypothetical protein [Paenibacillus durus]